MIGTEVVNRICGFERMVGKRSSGTEAKAVSDGGASRSENPGISNDKCGQNPHRRKDKVSWGRFVRPGLAGS